MSYYRDISNELARVPERDLDPPEGRYEVTDEHRAQALEAVTDELVQGREAAGFTLAAIFDCEADGNKAFAQELAQVLNLWEDNASAANLWCNVLEYQKRLVKKHIPESVIEERAEDLARDA